MGAKRNQILLIAGALVLFVLLFTAPKFASTSGHTGPERAAAPAEVSTNATLDMYLGMAQKAMAPEAKKHADQLAVANQFDSLALFWNKFKRPDLASYYAEEKGKALNTADGWLKAGNRYYYSIQFTQDKTEVPVLFQCAMRCFQKSLALQPKNTDAKIMLASCYVEGTANPMEGVKRLKEVERTDSNNVKLQLAFAFFSVKSGQLDKAIQRFNKVVRIDTNYIEAYLHLADAYERQGDTEKTIEMLKKYSAKTEDVTAQAEIEKYIDKLKTPLK